MPRLSLDNHVHGASEYVWTTLVPPRQKYSPLTTICADKNLSVLPSDFPWMLRFGMIILCSYLEEIRFVLSTTGILPLWSILSADEVKHPGIKISKAQRTCLLDTSFDEPAPSWAPRVWVHLIYPGLYIKNALEASDFSASCESSGSCFRFIRFVYACVYVRTTVGRKHVDTKMALGCMSEFL